MSEIAPGSFLDFPARRVVERVWWLRCGRRSGTGFVVDDGVHQFLITAAHVAEEAPSGPVEVFRSGIWTGVDGTWIQPDPEFVDVKVVALAVPFPAAPPLQYDAQRLVVGQEFEVLGYPFDPTEFRSDDAVYLANGSLLPVVKRGLLAWVHKAPGPNRLDLYLDATASSGFSGGPVVGYPGLGGQGANQIVIAAVVTHQFPEPTTLRSQAGDFLEVQRPTGLVIASPIDHALEGIYQASGVSVGDSRVR